MVGFPCIAANGIDLGHAPRTFDVFNRCLQSLDTAQSARLCSIRFSIHSLRVVCAESIGERRVRKLAGFATWTCFAATNGYPPALSRSTFHGAINKMSI